MISVELGDEIKKTNSISSDAIQGDFEYKSRSLLYLAECCFCSKQYVGNTIQMLRDRITGHRKDNEPALKSYLTGQKSIFSIKHLNSQSLTVIVSPEKLGEFETIWISNLDTMESKGLIRESLCAIHTAIT